jgi:hypothetical protein
MGVCERSPTLYYDLFVDTFFIVRCLIACCHLLVVPPSPSLPPSLPPSLFPFSLSLTPSLPLSIFAPKCTSSADHLPLYSAPSVRSHTLTRATLLETLPNLPTSARTPGGDRLPLLRRRLRKRRLLGPTPDHRMVCHTQFLFLNLSTLDS